jgi:hypothetical protein
MWRPERVVPATGDGGGRRCTDYGVDGGGGLAASLIQPYRPAWPCRLTRDGSAAHEDLQSQDLVGAPKLGALRPAGGRRVCSSRSRCAQMWPGGGIGLRRAIYLRSSVMRCAGSTGSVVGVSNSPGILSGSPYTSSATDACRSSLNAVPFPRRTRGSASIQCWSAWHMMAAFIVRWKRSTSVSCGVVSRCP